MNLYTKGGDKGTTSLVDAKNISKSDDRLELLGTIDELTSHIGEVKAFAAQTAFKEKLEEVQQILMTVMAGIADSRNAAYSLKPEATQALETEIDRLENAFPREKKFVLPGGCKQSARLDVARAVARRAERRMSKVSRTYGCNAEYMRYMNRLADYLYITARYTDYEAAQGRSTEGDAAVTQDAVVTEVMKQMGMLNSITLDMAKRLIEKLEQRARLEGKAAVIAVCNQHGNPVAVHCMDGAFLVSFDVATKKAYTAVAVKMSTMELSKLAQPGGTFYGLDKLDSGKMVIFGGGVPLKAGEQIIGGLGISGGTGEEDHALAEYGLQAMQEILG